MAKLSASQILKFDCDPLPSASEFPEFLVLDCRRYYPEPFFRRRYGLESCHFWDAFDVVLSDGIFRMKFVLVADAKVKAKVVAGCRVRLNRFSRFWREESFARDLLVVIHDLEVTERRVDLTEIDANSLPWPGAGQSQGTDNQPLITERSYYMDEWTFIVAERSLVYQALSVDLQSIRQEDICMISDVFTQNLSKHKTPILLVKVMRKSNLVHYITPSRQEKWPFQLPLIVADCSGWCAAVLWNSLGFYLSKHIHEGSLLLLKNFKTKQAVQLTTKSFFQPPDSSRLFDHEISIDADQTVMPVTLVTAHSSEGLLQGLNLPPLEFNFMTRQMLIGVEDFCVVDVAGLITFVGQVERDMKKVQPGSLQDDSGGFYYCRWVHLRDTSSQLPIILLLYGGEQLDLFFGLRPGQYLMCRHMLTNQRLTDLTSSRQQRYGRLTTTTNSWMYVFEPSEATSLPEQMSDIVRPSMPQVSLYSHIFLQDGFFRYPPYPCTLAELKRLHPDILQIVRSDQLSQMFDFMTWREYHQMIIHGSLIGLDVVSLTSRSVSHTDRNAGNDVLGDYTSHVSKSLGSRRLKDIEELWPISSTPTHCSALVTSWKGLNEPFFLDAIKPFSLNTDEEVSNVCQFLSGIFDSDLGLVDCVRRDLDRIEARTLAQAGQHLLNSKFVLLLDIYTNRDGRQVVVLNRAFQS